VQSFEMELDVGEYRGELEVQLPISFGYSLNCQSTALAREAKSRYVDLI